MKCFDKWACGQADAWAQEVKVAVLGRAHLAILVLIVIAKANAIFQLTIRQGYMCITITGNG
jgi:hypothetical protein